MYLQSIDENTNTPHVGRTTNWSEVQEFRSWKKRIVLFSVNGRDALQELTPTSIILKFRGNTLQLRVLD